MTVDVKIVSDPTLLNGCERWKSMVCGNETLAVIAGAWGKCYADGGMSHVPPLAGTLIAYVPADDCHSRHTFGAHATAQHLGAATKRTVCRRAQTLTRRFGTARST